MTKSRTKKYTVSGPHRVRETNPGEVIELDPDKPETQRLLARGQIAPAPSRPQPVDETPAEVESA